ASGLATLSLHDALPICFRAAEENRAASLHALLRQPNDWRETMPPRYWEALAQLRTAEASLIQSDNDSRRQEMRQLRAALVTLERSEEHTSELQSPYDLV